MISQRRDLWEKGGRQEGSPAAAPLRETLANASQGPGGLTRRRVSLWTQGKIPRAAGPATPGPGAPLRAREGALCREEPPSSLRTHRRRALAGEPDLLDSRTSSRGPRQASSPKILRSSGPSRLERVSCDRLITRPRFQGSASFRSGAMAMARGVRQQSASRLVRLERTACARPPRGHRIARGRSRIPFLGADSSFSGPPA